MKISWPGHTGVDFAYWWRCIGKGLRLQPAQQACFLNTSSTEVKSHSLLHYRFRGYGNVKCGVGQGLDFANGRS